MNGLDKIKNYKFSQVIALPENYYIHDFTEGPDPIPDGETYSLGRYNEVRNNMYTTELYINEKRNIHMGIDIGAPVGTPIYSFYDGEIFLFTNNRGHKDYGPTIITKHYFSEFVLYALYGHLSLESLNEKTVGQTIKSGEILGSIGDKTINGGWFPHLHFQLSLQEPLEANMPGVVSKEKHQEALKIFPDPRLILGPLYSS